jgi:hypothetical protein
LYEGFQDVFSTEVSLDLKEQQADHFEVVLQRGMHSGHLKLKVKLLHCAQECEITLCIMKTVSKEPGCLIDDSKS